MATLLSTDAVQRSLDAFPAGSNGEFNLPASHLRVLASGRGCRLRDSEDRPMLDMSMGWGSALPGHAHPRVTNAAIAAIPSGTNFAFPTMNSLRLAEELLSLQPTGDRRMRFCASGTEATMYCLRLARAFTGKTKVLKFEGAYHGSNDEGVTSLFPTGQTPFPSPEPSSAGISAAETLISPYNDLDATRQIIAANARHLAAVIVEPFHRCLSPKAGFLAGLRALCDEHGVLLAFDEVVTGFRMALGGAQQKYGVQADLVAYGKALGGGFPIGAFVARADIIDLVREDRADEPGYVWTASTLGGNPVSTAAASAAIAVYREPGTYERLYAMGEQIREGMRQSLQDAGHVGQVIGDGPLAQIIFTDRPVTDYRSTARGNKAKSRAMMLGLFERGVFVNPMGTKMYASLAHDRAGGDADAIPEFLAVLSKTLKSIEK